MKTLEMIRHSKKHFLCLLRLSLFSLSAYCQQSLNDLNVILKHDFENNTLGTYDENEWENDWLHPDWSNRQSSNYIVQNADDLVNPTQALQINFPANSLGTGEGGTQWQTEFDKQDELYLSYDVQFMPGFQFQHGGKLPSITGGDVGTSANFIRPTGYDGFTGGMMFHDEGLISFYSYFADMKMTQYGETIYWGGDYASDAFSPSHMIVEYGSGNGSYCIPGKWHNITYRMVLNTIKTEGGGNYDGILEAYFDGKLVTQLSHMLFRHTASLGINYLKLVSFFGGATDIWRNPIAEWLQLDNVLLYTFKDNIDVPRGHELSPTTRKINYWRMFSTSSTTVPNAPTLLTAGTRTSSTIALKWTDNATNEQGFRIFRSLSPASGFSEVARLSSNIETYTDQSLQPGVVYYYQIVAYNEYGSSTPTPVVSASLQTLQLPDTPSQLTAEYNADMHVVLNWNDQSFNEYGFTIERIGPGSSIKATFMTGRNCTSYEDLAVKANEFYTYRIRAYNSDGYSIGSPEIKIFTKLLKDSIWQNSLKAMNTGPTWVDLTWLNYPDMTEYHVERRQTNESRFTDIAVLSDRRIWFTDRDLSSATSYVYRIRAEYAVTNELTVTTSALAPPPLPPSNLLLVETGYQSASIQWTDNADNEDGFVVRRFNPDNISDTSFIFLTANSVSFTDSCLSPDMGYIYSLAAFNRAGQSSFCNALEIKTAAIDDSIWKTTIRPGIIGSSFIEIQWGKYPIASDYVLERKTAGGDYSAIALLHEATLSYMDTSVIASGSYTYRIRAGNASSIEITIAAKSENLLPQKPENFSGIVIDSVSILLTWSDKSLNEYGFILEKQILHEGTIHEFHMLGRDSESFIDSALAKDAIYEYRLYTYNGYGHSDYITLLVTVGDTGIFLGWNANVRALLQENNTIELQWHNFPVETTYKIERKQQGDSLFAMIGRTLYQEEKYTDDYNIQPAVTYIYRIQALEFMSEEIEVSTNMISRPPETPIDLVASMSETGNIILAWTDISDNEYGFIMERRGPGNFTESIRFMIDPNTTVFVDTTTRSNALYSYCIRAYNGAGISPDVAWIEIFTSFANEGSLDAISETVKGETGLHSSVSPGNGDMNGPVMSIGNTASDRNDYLLHVYPNPAADYVNISFTFENSGVYSGKVEIKIMDLFGKVWLNNRYTHLGQSFFKTVDTSNLPAGTFVFVIYADNQLFTRKIVIW